MSLRSRRSSLATISAALAVVVLGMPGLGGAAPSGSISGRVLDESLNPLAGICVNVTGGAAEVTDVDGIYLLPGMSSGGYTVEYTDCRPTPEYSKRWYLTATTLSGADEVTVVDGVDTPLQDVSLVRGATIEGTVTDNGGVPLESVCVDANVPDGNGWNGVGYTSTGPDGTYTFEVLPAADIRVRFQPCGGGPYVEQWYQGQQTFENSTPIVVAAGEVRAGVDAQLQPGAQVSGTVTDRNGVPLQYVDVNVNPDGSGSSAWGQTDADGHYTTGALPPGNYRVQFQGSGGFAGQFWSDQISWNNADLLSIPTGGAPIGGIDASLDVAASISGRVTDPSGANAANVCVNAQVASQQGFDWLAGTTTAADGTYTLQNLPPVAIKVQFLDCNSVGPYMEQFWDGQTDARLANDVVLTPGEARTGIDAHLAAATQIRGTVTNGAGDPLSGICAQATTATFVGGLTGTDSQGQYAITLAGPGDYRVQFVDCNDPATYAGQWWPGRSSQDSAQVVTVGAGQVVSGIDALLDSGAPGSISGRVRTARDTGMPTACVIAYLPTQFARFGAVGSDGSYEISNVPSGTYALAFVGCDGGDPQDIVKDPTVPGVTYPGRWWNNVALDITGTSNGGPDPIAQGANLVTVTPGAHLTGFDMCFGCGAIAIDSVTPGADDLTVAFDAPVGSNRLSGHSTVSASAAGAVGTYTLACSSGGGAAHTATGSARELTVTGLTAGATYGCRVTEDVDGTLVASSVDFSATIPRTASGSGTGGGSGASGRSMATTGANSTLPAVGLGAFLVLLGLVFVSATRHRSTGVAMLYRPQD